MVLRLRSMRYWSIRRRSKLFPGPEGTPDHELKLHSTFLPSSTFGFSTIFCLRSRVNLHVLKLFVRASWTGPSSGVIAKEWPLSRRSSAAKVLVASRSHTSSMCSQALVASPRLSSTSILVDWRRSVSLWYFGNSCNDLNRDDNNRHQQAYHE